MPPEPATPVLRFAPTPNGALHLGHAYSALFNERLARETGARLLLRMENLDRQRCRPPYEAAILSDLAWLGVKFVGPPRRQSEHADDYSAALARLESLGLVYPCFCSRAEVAAAAGARDPDGAPLYSGRCRFLSEAERRRRLTQGGRAAWRLSTRDAVAAAGETIEWLEYGEAANPLRRVAEPLAWGDVVLRGRDLAASYHLAVTVDDALQGVTDVARGRDLFASTSIHRLLQHLLGLAAPRYRHHRLVLDPDGSKLSKRRRSTSLSALRDQGVTPAEVRSSLGFSKGIAPLAIAFS